MSRECLGKAPFSLATDGTGLRKLSGSGTNLLLLLLLKAKLTVHSTLVRILLCLHKAHV